MILRTSLLILLTQSRFLNGNTRVTLPNAPGSLELVKCLGDLWGKGMCDGTLDVLVFWIRIDQIMFFCFSFSLDAVFKEVYILLSRNS